jgi:hypothetical protein
MTVCDYQETVNRAKGRAVKVRFEQIMEADHIGIIDYRKEFYSQNLKVYRSLTFSK